MKYLNFFSSFGAVLVLACGSGCAGIQRGAVIMAQSDFAAGNYDSALKSLSRGEGYAAPTPEVAAQISFLRGLCFDALNKPEDARASFKSVAADYPKTDGGFMAKQLLECEPLNLGPPWEPSASVRDLNKLFNIPPQLRRSPATASAISGDGSVVIAQQTASPRLLLWTPPSTENIFRWTKAEGARPVGAIQLPPSVPDMSYGEIINQVPHVSADGSVVAGSIVDTNAPLIKNRMTPTHAFRWTQSAGMTDLGLEAKFASTDVQVMSSDGSVLVGGYIPAAGTSQSLQFYRWTQARGFEDLGDFSAPDHIVLCTLCGVSDDGAVIAGTFRFRQTRGFHLFQWTQSGGFLDLGALGGTTANALCLSVDGSSLVAAVEMTDQSKHVLRWTQSGETRDLGLLGGRSVWPAHASDDGSVVVGTATVPNSNLPNAVPFRWTPSAGLRYVCQLGPGWDVRLAGTSRDCSKLLLNVFYLTASTQSIVIPVGKVSLPISHQSMNRFFYKSFAWDANAVSSR